MGALCSGMVDCGAVTASSTLLHCCLFSHPICRLQFWRMCRASTRKEHVRRLAPTDGRRSSACWRVGCPARAANQWRAPVAGTCLETCYLHLWHEHCPIHIESSTALSFHGTSAVLLLPRPPVLHLNGISTVPFTLWRPLRLPSKRFSLLYCTCYCHGCR